jgi:hypothetical protein
MTTGTLNFQPEKKTQHSGWVEPFRALSREVRQGALKPSPLYHERMGNRRHHCVYVIELSKDVLYEAKFVRANPNYQTGKPCVYVGMTGLDPDIRFDKHKAGIQSNSYVEKYGLQLLPDLYEGYNPMTYKAAVDQEIELGISLRTAGFGVWQA